jgi:hypothetical protein
VRTLVTPRMEAAQTIRRLLEALEQPSPAAGPRPSGGRALPDRAQLSADVAVRWLSHRSALERAARRFHEDAEALEDKKWATRLHNYAEALEAAIALAPKTSLERLAAPPGEMSAPEPATRATKAQDKLFEAAGFRSRPADAAAITPLLRQLVTTLHEQASALEVLARELRNHPARRFASHAD